MKMHWNRITCCITYHSLDISATKSFWHVKELNQFEMKVYITLPSIACVHHVLGSIHPLQLLFVLFSRCANPAFNIDFVL